MVVSTSDDITLSATAEGPTDGAVVLALPVLIALADRHLISTALFGFVGGVRSDAPNRDLRAPQQPTLVVAGDQDIVSVDAAELAERIGAQFCALPGRTHANAVSGRRFKAAVVGFLADAARIRSGYFTSKAS